MPERKIEIVEYPFILDTFDRRGGISQACDAKRIVDAHERDIFRLIWHLECI